MHNGRGHAGAKRRQLQDEHAHARDEEAEEAGRQGVWTEHHDFGKFKFNVQSARHPIISYGKFQFPNFHCRIASQVTLP